MILVRRRAPRMIDAIMRCNDRHWATLDQDGPKERLTLFWRERIDTLAIHYRRVILDAKPILMISKNTWSASVHSSSRRHP
jgi:hypothetical protein